MGDSFGTKLPACARSGAYQAGQYFLFRSRGANSAHWRQTAAAFCIWRTLDARQGEGREVGGQGHGMQCVAGAAGHAAVKGGILLSLSLALPLKDVNVF